MPSGKQSKRKRRVQPPPPARTRRRASPRVLIAAAAALGLIVVGIVLGVVLASGDSSSAAGTRLADAAEVQTLLKGIPQNGSVLGKASAPATMVEYVDLQCPFCQQFETQSLPTLLSKYVRTGKLKVEARPVAIRGPDSARGQSAAIAAGMQNKMFNFMQLLYDNQGVENSGWLNDSIVKSAAVSIPGLDVNRFLGDITSSAVDDKVSKVNDQSTADGLAYTPTILVGKTGSELHLVNVPSATDPSPVVAAIDAALR
jgi:protein-disulfide isomerase